MIHSSLKGIVYLIIAVYLLVSAYIRIKMHFWHTQPVFHIYNLKYWWSPPGTINAGPPPVNKFVNLSNNALVKVDEDTSAAMYADICAFIRENYVNHVSTLYKPSDEDILAYLQSANQPSFFNVYRETPLPFLQPAEIIGVTSARLLNVTLRKKKAVLTLPVYYIDNLCVKPGYRKKGIAPEMIQTFYYTISRANPKVNAYLFKREGQLNAIVPLVCYNSYAFDMTHYPADTVLTAAYTLLEIGVPQLSQCIAFIKAHLAQFECVILPDVSNVLHLLKLGKLKFYGVLFQGELIALYVFRVLALSYEDKKAVECIAILSADKNAEVLIAGFNMSWQSISAAGQYAVVILEETAHSNLVRKSLDAHPLVERYFKSPTAFFLYNYAAYSVTSTNALLIY